MGDQMRMTGLFSGLDTESIIQSLVSVKQTKVTNLKNDQTKLEWKQKAWQDLNSKVYSFYSGTLSSMRLTGAYSKKSTKISDGTKASIVASDSAVNGTQTLEVKQLAKSAYLTGAKLAPKTTVTTVKNEDGTDKVDDSGNPVTKTTETKWALDSKLSDLFGTDPAGKTIKVDLNGEEKEIELTSDMTITGLVNQFKNLGLNASFDENNQRFFISSKSTGDAAKFTLSDSGDDTLKKLGIDENGTDADYGTNNKCTFIQAQDAEIVLNGATFTSDKNTFTINGLTISATALTDDPVTITTDTDYDGIYDMIKDMLSEYNDVINDIYTKYNADSARKYNMLSEDEKSAMTDDEVEKWENTIKDSLLRRDKDLYTVMNIFTDTISGGVETDGVKSYLSKYGISTLSYFEAEESDRKSLHIDGNSDDEKTASNEDKLKAAIASDPEGTIQFFASLCNNLYTKLGETMKRSEYRSIYKIYDDKTLQSDYDSYTKKISEAQSKLEDYEDKWYDKFTSMETALSKLQSSQNALSGMLGS